MTASASDVLTVIITTSPTPSAPSTDLLSSVLQSYRRHCPSLHACRIIVVLDGYDQVCALARLKKGQVTAEQARNYSLYKQAVKSLVLEQCSEQDCGLKQAMGVAEYGSPCTAENVVEYTTTHTCDKKVMFIEPSRRLGFGLAVRSALRMTETPYVFVNQHDWVMVTDFPMEALLEIMHASEGEETVPIRYVCLPAVRMLSYAISSDVVRYPVLRALTSELKRDFCPQSQPDVSIPLTPFFFWHDKPHIASTAHYLARVFPSRLAMMRGDFIEDKIGQRARTQMKDSEANWAKWATWLYYPKDGSQACLRHLQGRTWRGAEAESKQAALWRAQKQTASES